MTDGESAFAITGVHHVQLAMPPEAEAEAERFYADLLGIPAVPKPENLAGRGGRWFRGAGVEIHLGVEDGFRPARKAHPALLVEGLDRLRERLRAAGVPVAADRPLEGYERFYVSDPFGNRIELIARRGGEG